VDCGTGEPVEPPYVETFADDLANATIPGGNGTFENTPYDAASSHLFADHFFWLPEGCYDVEATPVDENGEPSEDCAPAHAQSVPVFDGQVTEILLISQCEGDPYGGLDIIASLNHPPQITDLTYAPDKFICAGEEVEVCIDVYDPDGDPIIPRWGERPVSEVVTVQDDGTTTICATFVFDEPGTYEIDFATYDMGYDAQGNLVTIESLLQAQGDPNTSQDTITFPIHVLDEEACFDTCDCPEGFELTPAGDECIRTTSTEPLVSETVYQVCKAETNPNYSRDGAQYPDGTIVENSFWGESYNDLDSRLNTVGVWACDPDSVNTGETFPTTTPTQEWIGFTVCLDVEEAGDYIVGIAADNRVRMGLNGTEIISYNTNDTTNFTYWWNHPLSLGSGLNIVTLEGWNQSQAASFGAEVAGPFAPGSLVDDASMIAADYENNRIFSTIDLVGEPFDIGEASGYSCEEGWVLNTCGDAPVCTLVERVPCE
jgi:hypothetical protein